jgi:hypothetical protein
LTINHPNLRGARIIASNNQSLIKVTSPILEKEYNDWVDRLLKHHKSTSKLLLPIKYDYNKAGYCGQLGTANVNPRLPRCIIPTFLIFSVNKSMIEKEKNTFLVSSKCGIYFLALPRPKSKMSQITKLLVT